ncbi:MAG: cytochrome c biogenesis protein DipZ [Actinomycetota bacterium]|nr:cytochrome c biogenesis protein DipZ [Actinomycetota bacterium]
MAFAFLAGAATALSPCVLPVLPVALSAGVTGGRRRPLGVVTGLALSFAFATVALVYVIDALGLPGDLLRNLAIAVLFGFGLLLLAPPLAARLEAWISRVAPAPSARTGDGFFSGLLLGGSLGFVYAPCAGPILAGVITVSASQSFTLGRLGVALSYAIGSAVALYFLMLGGRRLIRRLAPQAGRLQIATGAVMVAVALLMAGDYDTRFQTAIANDLPDFVVNPTKDLEERDQVGEELAGLRTQRHGVGTAAASGGFRAEETLPVLGEAPEFTGNQQWFNTPGGRPLSLRELRGQVVLVDFWTYTCINCIRTFPYLRAWDERYRDRGLTIVGVHTPEFPFEREGDNVAEAIEQSGLRYPVVQDNEYVTWNAYANQYWPAKYLIDARGRVRYVHFGEGEYEETEAAIRELLAEAGRQPGGGHARARVETASAEVTTPESYLGSLRAERFVNGPITAGTRTFSLPASGLAPDSLAYDGRWRIDPHGATAVSGALLHLDFGARRVFLVLGADGRPRRVRVLLDGRPIPDRLAGADVHDGVAMIRRQRLYRLVELPRPGRHLLTLQLDPGVSGYAFTFG